MIFGKTQKIAAFFPSWNFYFGAAFNVQNFDKSLLIAVGIIVAATTLGGSLSGLFNKISTKLDGATTS